MRFLVFIFLLVSFVGFAQVKPSSFTEKTTATGNDETYSQAGGADVRIKFSTQKKFFTPDVRLTAISFVPTASGNTTNLMEFVVDSLNRVYFIDSGGEAFKLNHFTEKKVEVFSGLTSGNTITIAGVLPKDLDLIEVIRGLSQVRGTDYTISGQIITFFFRNFEDGERVVVRYPN